jgi:hypothetical protein
MQPRRPGLAAPSADAEDSPLLKAYSFVKERILVDESGNPAPIYLVIGTAGAGKTTYLSMLGEILRLRESKYYFPHEGIDVRRIQVERFFRADGVTMIGGVSLDTMDALRNHVRDLVFDFSQNEYSGSIARMQWPEHTPPDQRNSLFLVTELTQFQKTIARIVTFETSGEDFEAALKGITQYDPKQRADNPVHRILYELMDMASGFIILMTPEGRVNDEVYRDFFLALRDGLEPRGLNALASELRRRFGKADTGEVKDPSTLSGLFMRHQMEEDELKRRKAQKEKRMQEVRDYLRKVRNSLKSGDTEMVHGPSGELLKVLQDTALTLGAPQIEKAREAVTKRGVSNHIIVEFYLGLVAHLEQNLDAIVDQTLQDSPPEASSSTAGEITQEGLDRALFEIRQKFELSDNFRLQVTPELLNKRTVRRFKQLHDMAIVFTKTDMYASVHPPENFPAKNLQDCRLHLNWVQDYLRLLGGAIRYYNASATGYSILRDTIYVPGPENTLTPINVVEPVFEMLGIR